MAEPCSAAWGGRWSLAVLRPPSLHCQRQPAVVVAAVAGTCWGRQWQGCSCPSRRSGEAAAVPARGFQSRCRQQPRDGGRRCCLCLPGPAAASGNEHESARPRLLLHAQLLCKCCFPSPAPLLHVSQFLFPAPMLSWLPQIRPVLEARAVCGSSCPGSAQPVVQPPAKGGPLLLPPMCHRRMPWPLPVLCCCPARAQGHSRLSRPEGPSDGAVPRRLRPVLAWSWKITVREQAAPGEPCAPAMAVACKAGVCKAPSCAEAARRVVWEGIPSSASSIPLGKGVCLLRGRSDGPSGISPPENDSWTNGL